MKPFESQKKHDKQTNMLLKHEQGHFDITEIFKRKTQDTIRTLWDHSTMEIQTAVDKKKGELRIKQKLYDSLTNHNLNQKEQVLWNKYFDVKLRKH